MVKINEQGYLVSGSRSNDYIIKNSFLVKHNANMKSKTGSITLGNVHLPKELIGKKVRFKMEIVK